MISESAYTTISGARTLVAYMRAHELDAPAEVLEVLAIYEAAVDHLDAPLDAPEQAMYAASTPKKITAAIDGYVEALQRNTARTAARTAVEHVIERRVVGAMGRAAEAINDTLGPVFDGYAAQFAEAGENLPEDIQADSLIGAGGNAVDNFRAARSIAAELDTLAKLRRVLQLQLRIEARRPGLVPASALVELEHDADIEIVNNLMKRPGELEPWLSLQRGGARLRWTTCAEQRAAIQRMDSPEPTPKRDPGDILKRTVLEEPVASIAR